MIDYLMRWEKETPVAYFTTSTATRFLVENFVTMLVCSKILMNDQGIHFINRAVSALEDELQIQHKKSTPYHPQENGTVEAFNKVLEHALTKVCNENHDD